MTALEKWKNDFKEFISELSMPRDDYKGILEYIDEVPIEALEQQTCEDCISRQEALNVVHEYFEHYLQLNDDICLDGLRSLPSVTLKEKVGKWIPLGNYDECGNENSYKCSECGERNFYPDNYCHNCGAKMQEVKE